MNALRNVLFVAALLAALRRVARSRSLSKVPAHGAAGDESAQIGSKPDRNVWLLEEYKLLSSHYFHEDGQLFRTVGIFAALNGVLLAFLGSRFAEQQAPAVQFIPIIGIILCTGWAAMLVRIREWRNYIEARIREIEADLHDEWGRETPLDIRTQRRWSERRPRVTWYNFPWLPLYIVLRDTSASLVMLLLPLTFTIVWIALLLTAAI